MKSVKSQKTTASKTSTNRKPCRICGRRFNPDRVSEHERICEKLILKKRKVYNSFQHRIAGTENEKFYKKNKSKVNASITSVSVTSSRNKTISKISKPLKTSNWRKAHEDFINAIRAARQAKAHLAKGGQLSDLPPPPSPSINPDYIQCPYCKRRFNQVAAERHIPKCATYLHNKPKLGDINQKNKKK